MGRRGVGVTVVVVGMTGGGGIEVALGVGDPLSMAWPSGSSPAAPAA